jgi:hypothetical protein
MTMRGQTAVPERARIESHPRFTSTYNHKTGGVQESILRSRRFLGVFESFAPGFSE